MCAVFNHSRSQLRSKVRCRGPTLVLSSVWCLCLHPLMDGGLVIDGASGGVGTIFVHRVGLWMPMLSMLK